MLKLLTGLVLLSIAACAGLGYLVYDQRQDFEQAEERFDAQVEQAERELDEALAAALQEIPDVAQLESDVDRHEDALKAAQGVLRAQKGVDDAQDGQVRLLKTCINDAFDRLQRYSAELTASALRVASGGFASPPRIITPRCF